MTAGVVRWSVLARLALAAALAVGLGAVISVPGAGGAPTVAACPPQRATAAYAARVERALRSGRDLWGEALLAAPGGPTYERARRYLHPLLLARGRGKRPLTDSGVHYVPFAQPRGPQGAGSVALHVADGSQVIAQRVGGAELSVLVGPRGGERFGSCLARLGGPSLDEGWLPILQTRYVDAAGVRYRQESFAARIPETRALVSFVSVTADTRRSRTGAVVRFAARGAPAGRLVPGPGGRRAGSSVVHEVPRGAVATALVAWLVEPAPSRLRAVDEARYALARASVRADWERRLAEGATIEVPEARVMDALRALRVQNLSLTWRYSIGNPYEQFSFPEGVDVAQVMVEQGYSAVARSILRVSLTRKPTPYPAWKMGEKLLGFAVYHRLTGDRAALLQATPTLRGYVVALSRRLEPRRALLQRERYSSDIPDPVYGLHAQAVVWQGLRAMGDVWAELGRAATARQARLLAAQLERGLRRAVATSQRRLPDGSLFLPVRLLDGERAYASVTESRPGSYWNLVAPYALAAGLHRPGSPEAEGALRYLLRHGSRLLGLVRAGAYALYRDPRFPTSGTDQVYGINTARFLAALDEPDQLVLSLYGMLAAGMAPGTFVSGEAASVAPLPGDRRRAMYLPPNGASNAAFLATLRLMLVHERTDARGRPSGLELAFATPRAWLAQGRRVAVRGVPTSFGPVAYSLAADDAAVRGTLELPARVARKAVRLRVRLPTGSRITRVLVDGAPAGRVDRAAGTIDLSGRAGRVELVVAYARRSP